MDEYEDLIKHLRSAARWAEYGMTIPPSYCLKAADAVEELSREYDSLAKTVNYACEILWNRRNRWMPLPEPPKEVETHD